MPVDTKHADRGGDPIEAGCSWKQHWIHQMDGKGGFISRPAQFLFLPRFGDVKVVPFGLAAMDNGEILLLGAAKTDKKPEQNGEETVAAIRSDGGATWSEFQAIGQGRPVMLTWLGDGSLSYCDARA